MTAGLLKSRVRRLYLDFGVAIGPGVFTIDAGRRFVGVDEPKATTVLFTCITRFVFVELVRAERSHRDGERIVVRHVADLLGVARKND